MDQKKFAQKNWTALFKFLDFKATGSHTFANVMEYPCQLLRVGKIDSAIVIARTYEKFWESQLEILGKSKDEKSMSGEEFVKSVCVLSEQGWFQDEAIPAIVSAKFDALDENKDGLISLVEWRHHYERHGVKNEDFVRNTFAKMDSNNDSFISRQEFEHGIKMFCKQDPKNDYSFLFTLK